MNIEHVAMWTMNLERLKAFYVNNFGATASEKYRNEKTGFESYFLSFQGGCRLEIMALPEVEVRQEKSHPFMGLAHLAIQTGSPEAVMDLTERFRKDGVTIASEPRTTGDGYFESVILDPDGNKVEITA